MDAWTQVREEALLTRNVCCSGVPGTSSVGIHVIAYFLIHRFYMVRKPVYNHFIGINYNSDVAAGPGIVVFNFASSLIKLACALF